MISKSVDKKLAEKLMREFVLAAKALDAAELVAREIDDETARLDLRRAIGRVGASLYSDVMSRVFLEYPELEPKPDSEQG